MNVPFTKSFALLLFFVGCSVKPIPPILRLTAAEGFRKSLIEQLELIGAVEELNDSAGRTGRVHNAEYRYRLASDTFPPDRLYTVAEIARVNWGEYDKYPSRRKGGRDNHFEMHFGDEVSQAFIDVIAYLHNEQTRVDVLIRVLDRN